MNYSEDELKASSDKGMAEAQALLAASAGPIFAKDEYGFNPVEQAYAMGWNAVWVSEENRKRFRAQRTTGGPNHG